MRTDYTGQDFDASAHRDLVLSLVGGSIRGIAERRTRKILSQTGSFTVAATHEDLSSIGAFVQAVKGPSVEEQRVKHRAARRTRGPKDYRGAEEPRERKGSPWGEFDAKRGGAKPSLRVELASDTAEDVGAHVVEDLAAQAPPCKDCGRVFGWDLFQEVAKRVIESPEQGERLADLRRRGLSYVCPELFRYLNVNPLHGLPQKGPLSPEADLYSCRLRALAGHYAWERSMRYALAAARRGSFRDGVIQLDDGEEGEEVPSEDRPVWTGTSEGEDPSEVALSRIASNEVCERLTARILGRYSRAPAARKRLKVLAHIRESEAWPTGSEVGHLLGVGGRAGRQVLADLAEVIRAEVPEVAEVAR